MTSDRAGHLRRLATLLDPVRRRLYEHVAAQPQPVGRDAAAEAVGVSRRLAAFHLDKLADAGLLTATYRRLTGRSGPGAGRPAKLYQRAPDDLSVSVPPRDYELAAHIFVDTIASLGETAQPALREAAERAGRALARRGDRDAGRQGPGGVEELLTAVGYEPYRSGGTVRLRNCPFHLLAEEHRELVCGANLHLLRSAVGAVAPSAVVELAPTPGECCVRVHTA